MKFSISTKINAPADLVWQVLTRHMPEDPTPFGIIRLEGNVTAGARLKLWSEVDPNRAFALKVTEFEAPRRMIWRGGMPLGLFTGIRTFTLSSMGSMTRFEMTEVFSGPMARIIVRSIPDLTPSFEKFSNALKEKAETHE